MTVPSWLSPILRSIPTLSPKAAEKARQRQAQLTKPPGSLGRLEEMAIRAAAITGLAVPSLGKKRVILVAGDHGVAAEGVSAYPSSVTPRMVENFLAGGAAINALASQAGAEVQVVDAGLASPPAKHPKLLSANIRPGTRNLRVEPAMTGLECEKALRLGLRLAERAFKDKVRWVVLGEMGIGNTTPAAALMAALLPAAVEDVTGFGTGINRTQWLKKCVVIHDALRLHWIEPGSPLEALRRMGGLEIAVLTGLILGCARRRIPLVVDGFITSSAFLVAWRLEERVKDFCFFSHRSQEPGHGKFLQMLEVEPILDLGLRLGEGTGGALALNILESAVRAHRDMATFESARVPNKPAGSGKRAAGNRRKA